MNYENYILDLDNVENSQIRYESLIFAGGEPHIKLDLREINEGSSVDVQKYIKNSDDFMLLCVTINALKQAGIHDINLFIPYFPGARQDRVTSRGESLTAKVYANILNQFNLTSVSLVNVHSDVSAALIDNCYVSYDFDELEQFIKNNELEDFVLIAPDAGATKKTHMLAKYLKNEFDYNFEEVECSKMRDTKTGRLSGFKVSTPDLDGRPCIIYDDICDGGGTFIGLAKELKAKGAGDLYLYVTHGIFSHGAKEKLSGEFTKVGSSYEF